MAVRIQHVQPGSPAERSGLTGGMQLLSIDGNEIFDGLDYEFYSQGAHLQVKVQASSGEPYTAVVEKDDYQPLGCEFESYLIDKQHQCRNRCVFCFIDQLPQGMRKSLYFKDDDERMGFLFGNYITLTNLSEREVERIITMRFSPVNISVHTVNPQLRVEMMGNRFAGEALNIIPRLAAAGIEMNFQLVLCPGMNDGKELRRSIEWLSSFRPYVNSIAAVPVGLTRHRDGLYPLQAYTQQQAAEQLDIMLQAGERFLQEDGQRLMYPSDEWFLLAGRSIPPVEFYDGYPQLENGVGMWRLMEDEFMQALQALPAKFRWKKREADTVVGTLAAPLLRHLAEELHKACPRIRLHVHEIKNDFFGHGVTVTGLLTGQDVIAQLKGKLQSTRLLLPQDTLRAEGDMMLDDTTLHDIEKALDTTVQIVPKGGEELLYAILEINKH